MYNPQIKTMIVFQMMSCYCNTHAAQCSVGLFQSPFLHAATQGRSPVMNKLTRLIACLPDPVAKRAYVLNCRMRWLLEAFIVWTLKR